jgi:uridine phosphorylase
MSKQDVLPLLNVPASEVAPLALVMGAPERADSAAKLLEHPKLIGKNREYVTYTGRFKGERLTIASHGIGAAGAAICFEELARAGVKTFIRAGTCGALQATIDDGDLVIATAAVRDDGLTERLIPLSYPAVADVAVIGAIQAASRAHDLKTHTGLVVSSDVFYPSAVMPREMGRWTQAHVQAIEMELAALLIVAALHGRRAGGMFVVDGNLTRAKPDMSGYDPHRKIVQERITHMLTIGLNALVALG